jgi:hypothetical protein
VSGDSDRLTRLLDEAVAARNEATASAAEAIAARVAAEDELVTLRPLLAEARAQVERLEAENRALQERAEWLENELVAVAV